MGASDYLRRCNRAGEPSVTFLRKEPQTSVTGGFLQKSRRKSKSCGDVAERMRLERTMPCGTPHFQCGSLPLEYLSVLLITVSYYTERIVKNQPPFLKFFGSRFLGNFDHKKAAQSAKTRLELFFNSNQIVPKMRSPASPRPGRIYPFSLSFSSTAAQ